ncbi:MAG: chitobiase/beta-hexosaminidase C-terminal domain-containing protein, partial [Bacteroidales bacterium]|nr:chitobiase/beta-hexosaminidase C-terminal domain-containing protein [Bacteroidales bacterium]
MNRILLTNGMRKYLLMAALMLAAVLPAQATDYVITYTTGNTTYYLGMNGNTLQAKTTFDVTCIWTCYNGNNEASLGNTSYSLRNKENASAYLTTSCSRSYNWGWQYSWNALTVQNSASNIWRSSNGTNGNVYAYFSGSGYGTWNRSASIHVNTLSMEDDNTTDSKNYSVTTTPVAATLTGVSINGESTLSTTGAHSYTLTDGSYTNASTNYYFNGTDHYYPAQTTTTETPVGTWSVSGTGASYVSVDENTGTITVNSLPTDGDKTITLSCDPMYGTAHGATVTKTITLKARCQTPTFSFNNTNNQVTITTGTVGATIYYTTDGSEPTTSSTLYSGPFAQSTAATIKAIAVKDGSANSEVGEFNVVKLATPYARNNAAGNAVTFESEDDGVTFYYTYGNYDANGEFAAPTTSSTAWNTGDAAVSIPTENVVKVIAAKTATATTGYITSDVYARRVNTTDMSERQLVIMYNAGTQANPEVHFLANNNGNVQNTTTFDPSTCIWEALPFANPTAIPGAAALLGSDMKYEPFVRFRNNGRYLQLHAGPEDFNQMAWQEWVRLTYTPADSFYYYPHYWNAANGSIINAAHIDMTEQVVTGAASFQLGYNDGKWQRYAASGLALYNNSEFSVYYPVEQLGGGGFLLNVAYPANYETVKEEVNKGQSVTIASNITGPDGTGTGSYGLPYYRVGNEVKYFFYYSNTSTPLASEPNEFSTDIRITYELLNGTDYIEIDDATHTYTLVRDPGRDLYVTVRITATPYIDGVAQPDGIQTKDYQFHILTRPPFPAPVISRVEGTNDYQMECSASNAVIEYRVDGTSDCAAYGDNESATHPGWCIYDGPITVTTAGTIITARSYRASDSYMSDPVDYRVGGAMLLPPTIEIDDDGNVTITANPANSSLDNYTSESFYYTVNGSDPDPSNVGAVTSYYNGSFTVTNGQIVKAIAKADGFTNSAIASETYKIASGTSSYGVVTLNDYEDHNWSYYQASADLPDGYPDALHSPYPRNVQITYYGYGDDNLSTADAAAPAANTFNKNTTAADVKVGIGEEGHTFLYYKTLERDANGRYPYELIPNPFYVRPAVTNYTGTRTLRLVMSDAGGDGWASQLQVNFSDGSATQNFQLASGSTQTETFTVNSGVTVTLSWVVGGGKNNECSFVLSYDGGAEIYSSGMGPRNGNLKVFKVAGTYTVSSYTGFYKWRVKSITDGTIYTASTGNTSVAVGDMMDAETTYYFVPSDAGTTNANNATSMKVELEALWALAEVTTGTSFSKGYNSVERNFSVGRSGTNNNVFGSSTPCTYSSFYPNGTTNGTTAATLANRNSMGIGNPSAASKLEYYIISGNNSSMNAGGRNITIGRGVEASGTYVAQNVYGADADAATLNYRLRLESGSYQNFYLTGQGRTYSGVVTAKAIFGSDYDRAKEDNSKLAIAASAGSIYGGTTLTFSGTGNRNNMTFDWNIKSGTFHSGITGNASGGDQSIYLGSSQAGNGNLRYIGKRRIIVEGGEMAGIAGAMNNVSTNYGVNDGGWAVMVRVKGGTIRTSIYGAAAFAQAVGDRVMILTGGTVNGWIAGGCNGTQTGSGGTVNGDTKIYVGGNAQVKHTNADPTISTSKGGNVFGAGSGYSADYEIGEVNNSNVVVADNAEISRGVYGGGNYGYVGTGHTTNMFILGGKMANVFGGANQRFGQTVNITMTGGLVTDGLYGGSNVSGNINNNVTIKINGGQIGVDADHLGYVHGGGLGNATRVLGSVNMTIGESVGAENYVTIYGDVYGGSAQGKTNGNNSRTANAVTNVTMNAGKIHGSLYGGGLGNNTYAADVYGPVQVTVNGGGIHSTHQDGSGAVYGCNNVKGAPQSTVNVDIYGTDDPADGREYA